MSKQIVYFTRLTDENEWRAWRDIWNQKNQNQQIPNDKLEFIQNNITLIVKNGKDLLGNIPSDPLDRNMAFSFLQNLYNQIKDYKYSEIIIAIHFGDGRSYEKSLQPWIEHFNENGNIDQKSIAIYFLYNFNKPEKPSLTEYTLGTEDYNEMINKINNILGDLSEFYYELKKKTASYRLSLVKHRILNLLTPLQIDIEAFIEYNFEDKYWEYLIQKWDQTALQSLCNEVKNYIQLIDDKNLKNFNDTNKYVELLISPRLLIKNKYPLLIELLNSIKRKNKQKFQRIIRLHGNVYNKWLDELVNTLDELMRSADEINVDFEKKNLEVNCEFENIENSLKAFLDNLNIIKIINIGHKECENCKNNWTNFLKELSNNTSTAFLFYTTEELPRGDYPDSIYNETRLVREFFENSYCARTANYKNLIPKVKELILELNSNRNRDYKNVFDELNKLVEGYSN